MGDLPGTEAQDLNVLSWNIGKRALFNRNKSSHTKYKSLRSSGLVTTENNKIESFKCFWEHWHNFFKFQKNLVLSHIHVDRWRELSSEIHLGTCLENL